MNHNQDTQNKGTGGSALRAVATPHPVKPGLDTTHAVNGTGLVPRRVGDSSILQRLGLTPEAVARGVVARVVEPIGEKPLPNTPRKIKGISPRGDRYRGETDEQRKERLRRHTRESMRRLRAKRRKEKRVKPFVMRWDFTGAHHGTRLHGLTKRQKRQRRLEYLRAYRRGLLSPRRKGSW